jgi:uncharacterized protein YndB with AHSA1/START domain
VALIRRISQRVDIDAPSEKVWPYLTKGTLLSRWLMPTEDFQARVGHSFTFRTIPGGDLREWDGVVRCNVRELIPEKKLSWSWTSNVVGVETAVVIVLDDLGGRTRVTVEHSGWDGVPADRLWLRAQLERA